MSIPNKYKYTLEDLIDSLDIEYLAIPRQIDLPSNDISDCKDDSSDPKKYKDFLDRWKGQQQCRNTPFLHLNPKNSDEKLREGKKNRDKREHQGGRRKVVEREGRISEVSSY